MNKGAKFDQNRDLSPRLANGTKVRSFSGLGGYYQLFVENFSQIDLPLTNIMKEAIKFEWTPKYKETFQTIKDRLTSAPVLTLPFETRRFSIYNNAL